MQGSRRDVSLLPDGQAEHAAPILLREARATAVKVELAETPDRHTAARVERMLGQVDDIFAQARPGDDEQGWIQDLTPAEVAAEAGCAWRMIGRADKAAACADQALAGFGTLYPRSSQFNRIHRGQALLGLGELDEAIASARSAVPAANILTSRRCAELVRAFDRQLEPRRREPRVRQWREYLRVTLRSPAA